MMHTWAFSEPANARRLIAGMASLLLMWSSGEVTKIVTVNRCTLALMADAADQLRRAGRSCNNSQFLGLVAMLLTLCAMAQKTVRTVSARALYSALNLHRQLNMAELRTTVQTNT